MTDRRPQAAIVLSGLTSLVAIAALIAVLAQAPKLADSERLEREVRQQIVTLTLHLPPGAHITVTRKEVIHRTPPHSTPPGRKPAPAMRGRPNQTNVQDPASTLKPGGQLADNPGARAEV